MVEVQFNKSNNNPFYGLRRCLELFQSMGNTITTGQLDSAFNEVKDDKEKREMFFSLLFSVGDITAREHNIFKGVKKDSGGNANREGFWTIFNWLRENHKKQFIKFLNAGLFNEYQCFDTLFRSRVKTSGKGKNISVEAIYDIFNDSWYRKELAKYVYSVVNGTNPYNKLLVAKFLTIPRLSKRSGHSKLLPQTKQVMKNKSKFLLELSKLVGWEYEDKGSYIDFKGYKKWRKEYNGELESVLFSTQKINEFTKDEFLTWLDKLPSQARFRVKNRILYSEIDKIDDKSNPKPKWEKFIPWYKEWETYKEKKQEEQRVLEEKVRQGQASNEDREKLEKVKKQAKVTTGAVNFKELYESICNGSYDALKVEAFVQNKVNLPYNSLVIIDDSGSMTGAPFNFASFLASVCLVKNPDDDARNLLGFFNNTTHWHSYIDAQSEEVPNYFLRASVAKISPTPFVDPKKSFIENYKHIRNFCNAVFHGGGTNISGIPDGLHDACVEHPEIIDALKSYPIWTIISDGEWNNLRSPEASLNDFFRRCEQYFGFKPYIIAIDVHPSGRTFTNADRFSGIDNIMYIPSNPAQIEQFLTNFKNMDIYDVYTPLQSLHRSNRYELVRVNTI